jgi:nitrate/TMAO reductase-like tetraheme cytochrome c subunit
MAFWKNKQDKMVEQDLDGDDKERSARVTRKFNNAISRWRLFVVSLSVFIGIILFSYGAISYTSTPSFCANCHEMAPEHVTFQAGAHNQIKCTQCHIKPGTKNLVIHKINSLKEVYYHVVGPPDPIVQTVAVSNESCEQCHSRNRLVTATGDIIVNHKGHIEEEIPCITCHSGVAHAKVAERGINDSSTYEAWTKGNVKKLMGEKYEKPNMGTCIDCHDQVNQGKKPWKDIAYSLPVHNQDKNLEEVVVPYQETAEERAGILARNLPENTQRIILEAIGRQNTDVKLSMECFTCHQQIKTPENHSMIKWSSRHGEFAVKEVEKCLQCHKDSLWIKKLEKQAIRTLLLDSNEKVTYKQDLTTAVKESRNNQFCYTCHASKPEDHQDRHAWLYNTHRHNSGTVEERKKCFVCHDNEKPDAAKDSAPSDVYCEFCHKGDFSGESI